MLHTMNDKVYVCHGECVQWSPTVPDGARMLVACMEERDGVLIVDRERSKESGAVRWVPVASVDDVVVAQMRKRERGFLVAVKKEPRSSRLHVADRGRPCAPE